MRAILFASAFIIGGMAMEKMCIESNSAYAFFGYFVGIAHACSIWSAS